MKKLLAVLVGIGLSASAAAVTINEIPLPKEYQNTFVSDVADVISNEKEKQLDDMLIDHYNQTGNQVAVVTTPDTKGEGSPKMFAVELFNDWGLGDADKDNGLLLLLSIEDRKIVFETGYGLEGIIPDVVQFRVQQEHMVPPFKAGDYETGLLAGTDAILQKINKGMQDELAYQALLTKSQAATGSGVVAPELRQAQDALDKSVKPVVSMISYLFYIIIGLVLIFLSFAALRGFMRSGGGDYSGSDEGYSNDKHRLHCSRCEARRNHSEVSLDSRTLKLYTTPLEATLTSLNLTTLKFYQCDYCDSINKDLVVLGRIKKCSECNQVAKFSLLDSPVKLTNYINTYRDKNDRTRNFALADSQFVKLDDEWKEKSKVAISASWCLVCNEIRDNRKVMSVALDRTSKNNTSWNDRHNIDNDLIIGSSYSSIGSSYSSNRSSLSSSSSSFGSRHSSSIDTSSSIGFGGGDSGGGGASSSF